MIFNNRFRQYEKSNLVGYIQTMFTRGRGIFFGMLCCGLHSCTLIDDYVLGKDNTAPAKPLKEMKASVDLVKQWSVSVGKSDSGHIYYKLKPVTVGTTIYTADHSGQVTAVEQSTGHVLWSIQTKSHLVSGPSAAHGYLVLGTDKATELVLSQKEGHLVWEAHLSGEVLSKAAVSEDAVIVKTIDGHLYAFDLSTGKQRWVVEHGSPNLILKASSSPKIMGHLVLVGYSDGKLDAIDISTGRMVWQRSIAYANGSSDVERLVDIDADPMIRNNIAYLASYQGYIGALSLEDGQFIWSKPASVYKNMVLDQDTLYVSDSSDVLWAYHLRSGQIKWKQDALSGHILTEPIMLGHDLVVGDRSGYLHVISTTNGALVGRGQVHAAIDSSPALSGNQMVVMTADGLLQSFKIKTHRE